MASISTYLKNKLINHTLRNVSYTAPAIVYVALFTTDPTDDNTGTEVSGGSYARLPLTLTAPSAGTGTNTADLVFGPAGTAWGIITHSAIFDSLTGGNLLFHDTLLASKLIGIGDIAKISIGALSVNFD